MQKHEISQGSLNLSICLIAKNEENCIEKCLKSLCPLRDAGAEIVVVDTGSTDQTRTIAQKYANSVYDYVWNGDFAAARNFAASKAIHDKIFFIDCDESVLHPQSDHEVLLFSKAIASLAKEKAGMLKNRSTTASGTTVTDHLARVYDKTFYHYRGIVHEQLFPIDGSTPDYEMLDILLRHDGYEDPALMQKKAARNIQLLKQEYAQNPEDDYTLFQLAQSYRMISDYENALFFFEKALALDINPDFDYVKTLVESYGYTLIDLDRAGEALSLYGVYDTFATRADFVFMLGIANMQSGRIEEAISEFKKAVTITSHCIEGTNSFRAYYNLGVIYECLGQIDDAKNYYQKCGDYDSAKIRLNALS